MTHEDLKKAIQNKYSHPHWITLCEVSDASGFDGSRSIDVVAFGLYSSRGWEVHAFECKAFRSDWLKELRSPDKAETFHAIVDKFWIVAPKSVVRKEELPRGWGLIIVSGEGAKLRARVSVQATARDNGQVSSSLPRPFVAAMLTRMQKEIEDWRKNSVLRSTIHDKLTQEWEKGSSFARATMARESGEHELENLKKKLKEFEKASGIKIDRYTRTIPLGKRVDLLMRMEGAGQWDGFVKKTKTLIFTLKKDASSLEEKLAITEGLQDELANGIPE